MLVSLTLKLVIINLNFVVNVLFNSLEYDQSILIDKKETSPHGRTRIYSVGKRGRMRNESKRQST